MSHHSNARALERAAAPALAAIAEDGRSVPKWLRPLFAAIPELLFDLDLSLDDIQEAAGLDGAGASPWAALREEVGEAPWTYLRNARLETAAHLLLETEISISEIGRLVGYGSVSTFRRPLSDFLGLSPAQYRRRARRRLKRAGPAPAGSDTGEYWRRMRAGELSDAEARKLDAYLARLAPAGEPAGRAEAGRAEAGRAEAQRWARVHRNLAEGLVEILEPPGDGEEDERVTPEGCQRSIALTFAEQRRLAREAVSFPGTAFFELLGERGAAAGPNRGVELALLAVDSLEANGLLEAAPALASLAWARLARARWRAGDRAGAERDLERAATEAVGLEDGELHPPWEAERSRVEVAFHWLRGRRLEAFDLTAHMVAEQRAAIRLAGGGGGGEALFKALLLRAEVRAAAAELEPRYAEARTRILRSALGDVEEAAGTLDAPSAEALPASLKRALASLWARLLARAGNPGEWAAGPARVRRAAAGAGDAAPLLLWLEGHCAGAGAGAEDLWRRAREGFAGLGDDLWTARATLDLARLCRRGGRPGEATALASELASLLGAVAAGPEDLAALRPLGRRAPGGEVTAEDLDGAEGVLRRLEWPLRARRALDLAR